VGPQFGTVVIVLTPVDCVDVFPFFSTRGKEKGGGKEGRRRGERTNSNGPRRPSRVNSPSMLEISFFRKGRKKGKRGGETGTQHTGISSVEIEQRFAASFISRRKKKKEKGRKGRKKERNSAKPPVLDRSFEGTPSHSKKKRKKRRRGGGEKREGVE